jgi:predicted chitinase
MAAFLFIANEKMIDFARLLELLPKGNGFGPFANQGRYVAAILKSAPVLTEHGIDTPIRLAHFLGQGLIETGWLRSVRENLNYRADQLPKVFKIYRAEGGQALAVKDAGDQKAIANRAYGGRMGNTGKDDGWTYRGRGFFQVTGKDNYKRFSDIAGIDLVKDPDLLARNLKTSVAVAAGYWKALDLGRYADANDARAISRGINLGDPTSRTPAHSETDRVDWVARVARLLEKPDPVLTAALATGAPLAIGAVGPAVTNLQTRLKLLGFLSQLEKSDGLFGAKCHRAVVAFQVELGLPATGVCDAATEDAIEAALAA